MDLQREQQDDVAILVPGRVIVGGSETERLEAALHELMAAGWRKIVIDLHRTHIITSMPIKLLEKLYARARKGGVILCLCSLDHIDQASAIFWLLRQFPYYATREECLRALRFARGA
jgi:anti-anti-sigma regulatory factor